MGRPGPSPDQQPWVPTLLTVGVFPFFPAKEVSYLYVNTADLHSGPSFVESLFEEFGKWPSPDAAAEGSQIRQRNACTWAWLQHYNPDHFRQVPEPPWALSGLQV